jgi:hypothetical protein
MDTCAGNHEGGKAAPPELYAKIDAGSEFQCGTCDDTIKKVLYAAMERGGIGRVFEKLRKCLRAVMVEKEIETFEDERDLWL